MQSADLQFLAESRATSSQRCVCSAHPDELSDGFDIRPPGKAERCSSPSFQCQTPGAKASRANRTNHQNFQAASCRPTGCAVPRPYTSDFHPRANKTVDDLCPDRWHPGVMAWTHGCWWNTHPSCSGQVGTHRIGAVDRIQRGQKGSWTVHKYLGKDGLWSISSPQVSISINVGRPSGRNHLPGEDFSLTHRSELQRFAASHGESLAVGRVALHEPFSPCLF